MIFSAAQRNSIVKITTLVALSLMLLFGCSVHYVKAKGKATMVMGIPYHLQLTNYAGEEQTYHEDEFMPTGNLKLYRNSYEVDSDGDTTGMWEIVTDDSEEFTFKPLKERSFDDFYIHIRSGMHTNKIARAIWCEKIVMTKAGIDVIGEKGSTCTYYIGMYKNGDKTYYNADGHVMGNVSMYQDGKAGLVLEGAKGKTVLTLCSDKKNNKVIADNDYYLYGGKVRVVKKGKNVLATPGIMLSKKKTKSITNLYLRPGNKGENMFLTWNKVKRAKSYIVYKYSPVKNEYVKVAIRDSHNANYYNIPKANNDLGYKYKIVAKSKAEGKGKKVCKGSYPVWAVAAGNIKGNVTSVATSKKKITGKVGKSIKLTAKVVADSKTTDGMSKKVLSKTIRWYSSNKKIALINKKTGKVKFKKKGKCYI